MRRRARPAAGPTAPAVLDRPAALRPRPTATVPGSACGGGPRHRRGLSRGGTDNRRGFSRALAIAARTRMVPTRRGLEQLHWLVLAALPLHAFLSGLGSAAAQDVAQGRKHLVGRVPAPSTRRHRPRRCWCWTSGSNVRKMIPNRHRPLPLSPHFLHDPERLLHPEVDRGEHRTSPPCPPRHPSRPRASAYPAVPIVVDGAPFE